MDLTLFFTIIGLLLPIVIPILGYMYRNRKEMSNYYSLIWKSSLKLSPKDLLNERPFDEYYFEREVDLLIGKALKEKKNALIAGPPLSGKTRSFYNAVKNQDERYYILATRSIPMIRFALPPFFGFRSNRLIFIDDFQNFIEKQDSFPQLFRSAKEKNIPVIVTSHSGKEFTKAKNKLIENNLDADVIFGENIFEIGKVSNQDGKKIAEKMGREWEHISFNGTIGSIFMKLNEMHRRFEQCSTIEKTILRSMRSLYLCGVYEDTTFFKLDWIKEAAKSYELTGRDFEWTGWIKSLEEKEFVQLSKRKSIWAEDAYLVYIVTPETEIPNLELFEDIIEIFKDDAEVLHMAGERAYDTGSESIEISRYLKLSICAFERVLELSEKTNDKQKIFNALKYLGMSYWSLSKLENAKENCIQSINYFSGIFKRTDLDLKAADIAMIRSRMGNAYTILGETENKKENCHKAIELFEEALNTYSIEQYPSECAQVKNSLGGAYLMLSDDEDAEVNLSKAAECFEDSLKARPFEIDPKGYAHTKNNLANTFARLSQREDAAKNLAIALELYNDTLKIYLKEKYPMQYGMAHNNIGNVYFLLGLISDKNENSRKSIESYKKSLEVRTQENTPVLYSNTLFNLSDAYLMLGESENNPEYLKDSLSHLNELTGISAANLTPFRLGEIYFTTAKCHTKLAEFENEKINLNKAIEFYEKALSYFKDTNLNDMFEKTTSELQKSKDALGKIK